MFLLLYVTVAKEHRASNDGANEINHFDNLFWISAIFISGTASVKPKHPMGTQIQTKDTA